MTSWLLRTLPFVMLFGLVFYETMSVSDWLQSWIPMQCCVTNNCCWEIAEHEVAPLPRDRWQILATGEILPRTSYSPDGRYYRCACDYDEQKGKWIRHDKAHTRCLFVPLRVSLAGQ